MVKEGFFTIKDEELVDLKDKVAIITGASSGIGLATVELFISKGAHIVAADLQEPKKELPGSLFVKLDVTSWKGLCGLFRTTIEKFGRVDIVFANAGIGPKANYFSDELDEDGDLVEPSTDCMDVNLRSCMNTVTLGIYHTKKSGGSIIMTASASSYQRFPPAEYTTAKHGVLGFLRALTPSLHPKVPIRINAIAPAWTDTGIIRLPVSLFHEMKVPIQPASAVARSVGLLAVDGNRHGEMLYSLSSEFKEIEEPCLKVAMDEMGDSVEGVVFEELVRRGKEMVMNQKKAEGTA